MNKYPDFMLNFNWKSNPINYKWNDDVFEKYADTTDKYPRLDKALWKTGYKASIALAASLLELILCRFQGSSELSDEMMQDIKRRLDALWMAAIDPLYTRPLSYEQEPPDGKVLGPLWIVLSDVHDLSLAFNERSYYIHETIVGIALLAEYTSPEKQFFKEWFANTLKSLSEVYPCSYKLPADYNDLQYDCSIDPPVFRRFFFGSEPYDDEVARQEARIFMQSVKDKGNPYLRSAEEMIELGFKGIPYTI